MRHSASMSKEYSNRSEIGQANLHCMDEELHTLYVSEYNKHEYSTRYLYGNF